MRISRIGLNVVVAALAWLLVDISFASAQPVTRQVPSGGTTSFKSAPQGSDKLQNPEFPPTFGKNENIGVSVSGGKVVNRSIAKGKGSGASAKGSKKAKSNPELNVSFTGLNFRQQRLANGGNQFSIEPPDQGLCVGNGYVLESVNTVLRVFDSGGSPLTGVVDLNTFYGYPAAINFSNGLIGPFLTDPSCHFDVDTQRWFHVVLTLDTDPATGGFTGPNHIDIAVSQTASPLGAWRIYRLPVQNDGTQGTPNHHCAGVRGDGPCLGDYPHIGADATGFYITTNEFPFFASGFHGAQIYAFSKRALASGAASVGVVEFDTANPALLLDGAPGFTVWPAISPGTDSYANDLNGTEYFLSSQAVFNDSGSDDRIRIWALTNTHSLDTASPAPALVTGVIGVAPYGVPPPSDQKAGNFPLGQCLNDDPCSTFLIGFKDPSLEVEGILDSNDSRMQQIFFANGKLWGALDTVATVGGTDKAGIAYYVIKPQVSFSSVGGKLALQGVLALENNNLIYPALAVTPSGRGVIAFTLVGADHYPTAGYAGLDAKIGAGDIHVAAEGIGPQDGFTEYPIFGSPPRWGDYGAAATDGNSLWIASEFIDQTCTLAQYEATPFGSCGGTRAAFGNWATRVSKVTP